MMIVIKNKISFVFILLVFCFSGIQGQIITVKQDGTGDYMTVQEGVDASTHDDTVLVWPGTYIEDVYCYDKNITLASLWLTTKDTSFISQTIILREGRESCLVIENCDSNFVLAGFLISHESFQYFNTYSGGGIHIYQSTVSILHCEISNCLATNRGGGIAVAESNLFLSGSVIKYNHSFFSGGGISFIASNFEFDTTHLNSIYCNYSGKGTDVFKRSCPPVHLVLDTFTVAHPDYYYIYSEELDLPINDITWDIQEGKLEQTNQDLYVSPEGSNLNSGLSPQEPLHDIWYAMLKARSDMLSPDTIHIAPGTYRISEGEKFPISLKHSLSLKGFHKDSVILDGEGHYYLLNGIVNANAYELSNFTVYNGNGQLSGHDIGAMILTRNYNSKLSNLRIWKCQGDEVSGVRIGNSDGLIIRNVEFVENVGSEALRLYHNSYMADSDTVSITGCRFYENLPNDSVPDEGYGGSIALMGNYFFDSINSVWQITNCLFHSNRIKGMSGLPPNSLTVSYGAEAHVVNCTFGNNIPEGPVGANIGVAHNSTLNVYNSIMYNNPPAEFYMFGYTWPDPDTNYLNIYNSDVMGGEEGIRFYSPGNFLYYDPSNIDQDPLWDTLSLFPYSLSAGSPCIDAGSLEHIPEWIELPEFDLAGNPRIWGDYIDMGAYEYGPWVGTDFFESQKEHNRNRFLTISPNPFWNNTQIKYVIPEKGKVMIKVHDLSGTLLHTLLETNQIEGEGAFSWDGTDAAGRKLSSGSYIISLIVNEVVYSSRKVIIH